MARTFTLKNINASAGDKVVIIGNNMQVLPWSGSIMPIIGRLVNKEDFGFIPSGTYTVTAVTGDAGFERHYEITGPV
jgi:hypothetical protein